MSAADDTIAFSLTREKADFFPATLLMMMRTRVPVLVLLNFIVLLATMYVSSIFRDSPALPWVAFGTFLGVGAYAVGIWLLTCYFVARRGWSAPGALSETRYVFSSAGIAGEAEAIQSNTAWSYWKKLFETSRFLIIVSASGQWMFFSKRSLAPDTLMRLESLARAKLNQNSRT